tara:strand:- start:1138 stop:1677 length:540 start_codon:yes stop_codon:yes gene_type:complete
MVLVQENRYNKGMGIKNKYLTIIISTLLLTSCASMNNLLNSEDNDSTEVKELSASQRLQISLPLPDNTKINAGKTIIFGEGSRFTGVLNLLHEISQDEIVEFYRVEMRDDGWSEIAIVRSDFVLMNFDKEDRFATIRVNRGLFSNSSSEVTVGMKSETTLNRSINTKPPVGSDEPFTIQ